MYKIFNTTESAKTMYSNYDSEIYTTWIEYADLDSEISGNLPLFGAFHGIFVPMLSTINNYNGYFPEEFSKDGYVEMSEIFNSYLKNFLYTGNPNSEGLVEWSNWTPDNNSIMVLDADNETASATNESVALTYEEIVEQMEEDTTVSDEIKHDLISQIMNGRWFSEYLDEYYDNTDLWK